MQLCVAKIIERAIMLQSSTQEVGMDDMEFDVYITALKKAAIVMDALAMQMKDAAARSETKSLAYTISWAVQKLEEQQQKGGVMTEDNILASV
jgi:hypothetical protein